MLTYLEGISMSWDRYHRPSWHHKGLIPDNLIRIIWYCFFSCTFQKVEQTIKVKDGLSLFIVLFRVCLSRYERWINNPKWQIHITTTLKDKQARCLLAGSRGAHLSHDSWHYRLSDGLHLLWTQPPLRAAAAFCLRRRRRSSAPTSPTCWSPNNGRRNSAPPPLRWE